MKTIEPTFLLRHQVCDVTWNVHIGRSMQCVAYAFSDYLDAVCDDWMAYVWPSANEFSVVMPVPVRMKFAKKIAYQPIFCQYLGLFSIGQIDPAIAQAFLNALSRRFSYISAYAFNPENSPAFGPWANNFPDLQFRRRHTYQLSLMPGYDDVVKAYSADRKRNLRKGRSQAWNIETSTNVLPLIKLFKENHASAIGAIHPYAYKRLGKIFERLSSGGNAEIHYAVQTGHIHAGIMLVWCSRKVIYIFNAANATGRGDNARTVLIDAFLKSQAASPTLFDFESPEITSIENFYRSFGSVKTPYFQISKNRLWYPIRQVQNLQKWLLKTRRCLFANLCMTLNPFPKNRF